MEIAHVTPHILMDPLGKAADGGMRDDETDPLVSRLRLAGVVSVADGMLRVRNRIYRHAFERTWTLANMPDAEVRRQRAAYRSQPMPTNLSPRVV